MMSRSVFRRRERNESDAPGQLIAAFQPNWAALRAACRDCCRQPADGWSLTASRTLTFVKKSCHGSPLYGAYALRTQQEGSMSRYIVHFMKDVLGENGRQIEVCQGTLEIDAASEGQATELAKKKFCEAQALRDWSLHADRIKVKQADFPS
jgi:hypothetical protein